MSTLVPRNRPRAISCSQSQQGVSPNIQLKLRENWYEEIRKVAAKFVLANCFDPSFAGIRFDEILD
jgi:hypothetical protein